MAVRAMWVALYLKISLLFIFAVNTMFVMDEFWQFGQAKHLFDEFFHTVWPGKTVGANLFFKLSHWIGWDAQSMVLSGRIQTALLTCATLYIIYRIALSMGEQAVYAAQNANTQFDLAIAKVSPDANLDLGSYENAAEKLRVITNTYGDRVRLSGQNQTVSGS